ncbi:NAD(P)/FAD-dependent oxidoreductase [Boudabousia marimammalium]|uniref:NADH dehydrogenase n=1 Tax=Boudabousia marimammalium TaxID=156892 RepID=A0A1Q5PS60_9ACTO|nr:NAD(P)/FAD-dependent oxidoreductase [Boudabousia marimammalium]OKL50250.1 NADH dehydrogenase [Boudabousia marimammalium]
MRNTTLAKIGILSTSTLAAAAATYLATRKPARQLADQSRPVRVLVAGGGYIGLIAAQNLRKQFSAEDVEITVVDPRSYMTYQPFLPEAAGGNIEPRHVVAPHRIALRDCRLVIGKITDINHGAKTVTIRPETGDQHHGEIETYKLEYDHIIIGLGAEPRTLPIPGLADMALGFKQVEEAINLRNRVLNKLEVAASSRNLAERSRLLTFVFVGGGFAGIEAIAEVEDMARAAVKRIDNLEMSDLRLVMVEGARRILPELGEELGGYALEQLQDRGIDVRLNTFLTSCVDGNIELSDGSKFEADTLVWTAGVKANPVLDSSDLPLEERGRVTTNAELQVIDAEENVVPGAWAAGDCAAVPDLNAPGDATCPPTAQHAVRQAKVLAENLAAQLSGEPLTRYSHKNVGTVASLGLLKGVAEIAGVKLRGPLAWFAHRSYHMMAMPTWNRKARIVADWTMAMLFQREIVALGSLTSPRAAFRAAAQADERRRAQRGQKAQPHKVLTSPATPEQKQRAQA